MRLYYSKPDAWFAGEQREWRQKLGRWSFAAMAAMVEPRRK
jgi:hypothetical protein